MTKRKITILKQQPQCPKCGGRTHLVVPRGPDDAWSPFFGCDEFRTTGCRGSVPVTLADEAQSSFWERPETMEVWVWA